MTNHQRPAQRNQIPDRSSVASNPSAPGRQRRQPDPQQDGAVDRQMLLVLAFSCPIGSAANQTAWQAVYAHECGESIPAAAFGTILKYLDTDLERGREPKRQSFRPVRMIQGGLDLELWRASMCKLYGLLRQALTDEANTEPYHGVGLLQAQRMRSVLADMSQSWPYALIDREQLLICRSDEGRALIKANWMGELMEIEARLAIVRYADPVVQRLQEDYSLLSALQQRLAKVGMPWQQRLPLCTQKQDALERIAQARQGIDLAELAQSALERKQQAEVLPEGPERDQLMRQAEVLSAMAVDPGYTDALWAQREWLLKCIGWAEACQPQREPLLQQRSNLDRCQRPESGLDLIDTYGQFVADTTDARYAAARGQVLAFTQRMRARREAYAAAALTLEGQQRQYQSLAGRLLERPLSSAQFQQLYNLGSQIAAGRRQLDEQRQFYERDMRAEALRRGLAAGEVTLDAPQTEPGRAGARKSPAAGR